jgi:CheY-like chemotaxis protein
VLRAQAGADELAINVLTNAEVPLRLRGDPGKLRQLLLNLGGNAIKFTPQGTVSLHVELLGREGDMGLLRFTVTDTGIGIEAQDLPKLFQPFSQIDSSLSKKYSGTGLGLAICKRLVELLGGEIGVRSSPQGGSSFWFSLPLEIRPDPSQAALPEQPTDTLSERLMRLQGKLLLVEDKPDNRIIIVAMLRKLGLQADIAEDGQQAIDATAAKAYEVVLMDCQMPGVDGYAATRAIRAREAEGQHTHIIALTANALKGDREKCLAAGMDDYIAKPATVRQLQEAFERWMTIQRARPA